MARALAAGWVARGVCQGSDLLVADPVASAVESFQAAAPGARAAQDNAFLAGEADVIVLAVKPQHAGDALEPLGQAITDRQLVISIVAGLTLRSLQAALASDRLARVMPNTPCLIGRCAAGYSLAAGAKAEDARLVAELLGAVGQAHELPESLLDAVTGLSGSGPAFVYLVIEALADGGVRMGLPRAVAADLAAQTVAGAAEMVLSEGVHPAVLKDRVASPGGTTIAGLAELEQRGVRGALIEAVAAATQRSRELGQQKTC